MADEINSLEELSAVATGTPMEEAAPREPVRDELGRSYATGKRKDAVARVWIKPGSGKVTVNGKDQVTYFGRPALRMVLKQPFEEAERVDQFDVMCTVNGGGLSGQAGAQRRAEFEAESAFAAVTLGSAQVAALRAARAATYDAVEAMEGGLAVGTRTAVDLVQALRERYDAERALTRVIHVYLLNSMKLKAAAGDLGPQDLMRINQLLKE